MTLLVKCSSIWFYSRRSLLPFFWYFEEVQKIRWVKTTMGSWCLDSSHPVHCNKACWEGCTLSILHSLQFVYSIWPYHCLKMSMRLPYMYSPLQQCWWVWHAKKRETMHADELWVHLTTDYNDILKIIIISLLMLSFYLQTSTGAVACQLLDALQQGSVAMSRVKTYLSLSETHRFYCLLLFYLLWLNLDCAGTIVGANIWL